MSCRPSKRGASASVWALSGLSARLVVSPDVVCKSVSNISDNISDDVSTGAFEEGRGSEGVPASSEAGVEVGSVVDGCEAEDILVADAEGGVKEA